MQKGDVFRTESDITNAKKIIGYNPKICLKNGLEEQIKYLENQNIN